MWTNKYIGIPYKANGRTADGLDCWGLVRLVYKEQYNIDLPSFTESYKIEDTQRLSELIAQNQEGWEEINTPVEGSVVLLRILGQPVHVGIVIENNQFLHVREGTNSAVEKLDSSAWNKRIIGYYRYNSNKSVIVNAVPHPLKTERITFPVVPGTTLQDLYTQINSIAKINPDLKKQVTVLVNGEVVPQEFWGRILQESDVVEYRAVPGREAVRTALLIVIAIYAPEIAGMVEFEAMAVAASTAQSAAIYYAAYAATLLAGSYLVNVIAPIRPPSMGGADPGSVQRQNLFTGGANQYTPYGAIPVILGKVRITPPLGARTYIEYVASNNTVSQYTTDSYLNMLLVWGYGPLAIDDTSFRIGETAISNYSDWSKTTLDRIQEPSSQQLIDFNKKYATDTQQVYKGITLAYPGGTYSYTETIEQEDVQTKYDDQGETTITTRNDIEVKHYTTNEGGWVNASFSHSAEWIDAAIHFPEGLRALPTKGENAGVAQKLSVIFEWRVQYTGENTYTNLPNIVVGGDAPKKDAFTFVASANIDSTKSGFTVQVRRVTDDQTEPEGQNIRNCWTSILHSVTSHKNSSPPADPLNCKIAKTAFTIKATDQLNGQIEGISALVQTYCLIWNGSSWVNGATSNPAALFRYILTHPANPQRILESEVGDRINLTQLQYWYNYCATKGFEYNNVITDHRSVLDILRDICAAGRASPALVDGKWTVNIDEPKDVVVQHFTPHNSWGFESTKVLPKYPDALKVQFYDEENNYQQSETIVAIAGKTVDTAELFETIQLPGVTKKTSVVDHARWHFAQIKLRPELYTLNTDFEYLVCNRGDRVKVLHDVPMWGLQSGRVKNKITTTVLELDEKIPYTSSKSFTFRFRGMTGVSTTTNLKTQFLVTSRSIANNLVTITLVTTTGNHPLQVGDQISVNTSDTNINTSSVSILSRTNSTITYALTRQFAQSASISGTVDLKTGYYSTVEVMTALTTTQCESGCLFLFGENQRESQDLLVLKVEPTGNNKSARLTLVDYGVTNSYNIFTDYPNVTASTVFETNITDSSWVFVDTIGDSKPGISTKSVISDERVMEKIGPGVFRYNIRVSYTNPVDLPRIVDGVEGEINYLDSANTIGVRRSFAELGIGSLTFDNVDEGGKYKMRLRYTGRDGRTGVWTDWIPHTVVGKNAPPSDVTNFVAQGTEAGIRLKWTRCPDVDYDFTEIRYGSTTWADAISLFRGSADTWTWLKPISGNYKFWIKHFDTSGNQSVNATTITLNYVDIKLASIVPQLSLPNVTVTSDTDGSNPVLTNTGTTIAVLEGSTQLKYDAVGTAPGKWKVVKTDSGVVSGSFVGVTDPTNGDNYATVNNLTAFAGETGTITYTITGKTTLGDSFTIIVAQKFSKAKAGTLGKDALIIDLISEAGVVNAASDGTGYTLPTGNVVKLYSGGVALTTGVTYGPTSVTQNGLTLAVNAATGAITLSGSSWTSDTESFIITATYNSNTYTTSYSIAKSRAGSDAIIVDLASESDIVSSNNDGTGYTLPTGNSIKLYKGGAAIASGVTYGPATTTKNGLTATVNTTTGAITLSGTSWTTDTETFSFTATYSGVTYTAIYSIAKSKAGINATQGATVNLYQWALTQPGNPSGESTWTWSTAANSNYTGGNGWLLAIPANAGTPGLQLWIASKSITSTAGAATTTVNWSSGYSIRAISGNGTNGVDGVNTATATVYQWAATIPASPTGTSTWTWNTGTFTPVPTNWTTTPGTSPSLGYTLWGASVNLLATAGTTTSTITWTSASITARGYAGTNGGNGTDGASYRLAYAKFTGTPSGTPTTVTTDGKTSYPSNNTWGNSEVWSGSVMTLSAGESMYQIDGIYSASTDKTVWGYPYLSNLKVGSLSAISANLGSITAGSIDIGSGKSIIDTAGNASFKSVTIKDTAGNTILQSGPSVATSTFNIPGSLTNIPSGWLNTNISIDSTGKIQGIQSGSSGTAVSNSLVTTLTLTTTNATQNGNTVTKTSGADPGWDSQGYSIESYTNGAYCSFRADSTSGYVMAGLNTDPAANANYTSLDYAVYLANNGSLRVYESGADIGGFGIYAVGDIFSVTYDGSYIRYYKNGGIFRTVQVTITDPLYFDSSLYSYNNSLSQIKFGPLTSNNWNQITNQPAGIFNTNISVDSNGAIQGIQSGSSGTVISNTKINVDGNGQIQGIGSGAGTTVSNTKINVDSNGQIQGIGSGAGTTVSNTKITLDQTGNISGIGGSYTRLGKNLLDSAKWVWNSTGSQTAGAVPFYENAQGDTTNQISLTGAPDGTTANIWVATSGNNGAQGGWNTGTFPIDHTKPYRFTVWIRRVGSNSSGSLYLGVGASTVNNIQGGTNDNPYFVAQGRGYLPDSVWCLVVGYVWPSGYGGGQTSIGGLYNGQTGAKILSSTDYRWVSGQTTSYHRAYQYYTSTGARQDFFDPRVEIIDGTEPSIDMLLAGGKAYAASLTSTWTGVSGSGKPEDNATLGASWGSNLTGRPSNLGALSGGEAIQNTQITVDGNGAIQGIASGSSGTVVNNTKITVDGDGKIQGIASGSSGTAVANSYVETLNFGVTNCTAIGNVIKRTSGSGSWDSQAYSLEGYSRGAFASFSGNPSNSSMAGLNTDPTADASYTSIDYAVYFANGGLYIYESGGYVGSYGSYTYDDIFAVTYDGSKVRYYKNGSVFRTVTPTNPITNPLYFDSSIVYSGEALKRVKFGPLTSNNWAEITDQPAGIYNSNISVDSNGAIQGISSGSNGTAVANSKISISSSGVLSGAGGGTVTIAGMDSTVVRSVNPITADNITTYISGAAIGNAQIGNLSAGKINAGTLDAARIAAGSINADKLTVGTLSDSVLLNSGFEEASSADSSLPSHWNRYNEWGTSTSSNAYREASGNYSFSGYGVLVLSPGAGASSAMVADRVPVSAGEIWYVSCWARAIGTNAGGSPGFYFRVKGESYTGYNDYQFTFGVENYIVPTSWTYFEGKIIIQSGCRWAAPMVLNYLTNTGHTLLIDQVEFKKAVAAGNIDITGGATNTGRVRINNNQFVVYDNTNTIRVKLGYLL